MSFLEQIPNELYVIAMSMMPVVELRGAIPLGVSLGFSTLHSTIPVSYTHLTLPTKRIV